jgi:hypothetical protein
MKVVRLAWLGTALGVALLAPCVEAGAAQDDHAALHSSVPDTGLVREVKRATAAFVNDAGAAERAGYRPFLDCVDGAPEPQAMGLHYVNGDLVKDGVLEPSQPEGLMYERRNGRLHLLGVEYIVDVAAWHKHDRLPPALLGQVFTSNGAPNRYGLDPFYALDVWAWQESPHGTFVNWNPLVSCDAFTGYRSAASSQSQSQN